MYLSASEVYSKSISEVSKTEKNDCVVRSIASAADVTYKVAHDFCSKVFGRETKKGVNGMLMATAMLKAQDDGFTVGTKEFDVYGLTKKEVCNKYKLKGEEIWRKKTIKSFVQSHPVGTFLVMVANHALCIKDGELLDWESNKFQPTRKVVSAYKLTAKNLTNQLSLF
tara:strand:+ start:2119 stop:2622 length:504 start_codon:yes stop_codon:yes gene_type:complete